MEAPLRSLEQTANSIPRLSRLLSITLAALALLTWLLPGSRYYLALIPSNTLPPHFFVWNVVSCGLLDESLPISVLYIGALLACAIHVEVLWGPKEFLRFIFLVNLQCGLATFAGLIVFETFSFNERLLYHTAFCGLAGTVMAQQVALKQLLPELSLFGLRAKHLPLLHLALSVLLSVLGLGASRLPFVVVSLVVSWVYLRHFQRRGDAFGDHSAAFDLVSFFPDLLQPHVSAACDTVERVLRALRLERLLSFCIRAGDSASRKATTALTPADADAERRRARALLALDQRMAEMEQARRNDVFLPNEAT